MTLLAPTVIVWRRQRILDYLQQKKGPSTSDGQGVTSMLKLPEADITNREQAVNTIRQMMPASPYRIENLEQKMSALHTGPWVEAGTSTQEKPPPKGISGIAEMKPQIYIEERASSLVTTAAPSVPVKLSDYSEAADDEHAIECVKSRARSKTRNESVPSTSMTTTRRCSIISTGIWH